MTTKIPTLDSEPLIYFLVHSAAFVLSLAAVFVLMGIVLGWAFWGRYKRWTRELSAVAEAQRNEVADLKRKLAEQAMSLAPRVVRNEPLPSLPPMPELANATAAETSLTPPQAPARSRRTSVIPEMGQSAIKGAATVAPFGFLMENESAADENREPADVEA